VQIRDWWRKFSSQVGVIKKRATTVKNDVEKMDENSDFGRVSIDHGTRSAVDPVPAV